MGILEMRGEERERRVVYFLGPRASGVGVEVYLGMGWGRVTSMALYRDGRKIWWYRLNGLVIWDGEDWGGRFKVKGKGVSLLSEYPNSTSKHLRPSIPSTPSSPSLPNDRPPSPPKP